MWFEIGPFQKVNGFTRGAWSAKVYVVDVPAAIKSLPQNKYVVIDLIPRRGQGINVVWELKSIHVLSEHWDKIDLDC